MSENYNEGNLSAESQSGPQLSEQAREQFQENHKKNQQAIKKVQQAAKKKQITDSSLAYFLTDLLKKGVSHDLLMIVLECIENNIPSEFIIAILSVKYPNIAPENENISHNLININTNLTFNNQQLEQKIQDWTNLINQEALKNKTDVVENIIHTESWSIHECLITLSALLLQSTMKNFNQDISLNDAKNHWSNFYNNLLNELQK